MTATTLPRSRTANGIAWHQAGHGEPLVLIHGVGLSADCWYGQIERFSGRYTVYAIDLPGHGESAAMDARNPGLAGMTRGLKEFIDTVIDEPALIAGHSLGALIALDFARQHPRMCSGVAALSTLYQQSDRARNAIQERAASMRNNTDDDMAIAPVSRWFGPNPIGQDAEMAALCLQWLRRVDRDGYANAYSIFANEGGPLDNALAALPMPVLFLAGQNDANSTPSMSRAMAQLTPHGQAIIIDGARHMVQMSHFDETNTALLRFFETCCTASSEHQISQSGER